MKHLVIRADANKDIGGGHLMRSLVLAQEAKKSGVDVSLLGSVTGDALLNRIRRSGVPFTPLTNTYPNSEDLELTLKELAAKGASTWLVMDGYHFDETFQQAAITAGHKLLVIDDYHHLDRYSATLLLNQNLSAFDLDYSKDSVSGLLMGPEFALLREEFRSGRLERAVPEHASNILVTFGAGDDSGLTTLALEGLAGLVTPEHVIRAVIGPENPDFRDLVEFVQDFNCDVRLVSAPDNMARLMIESDLAISASGSTTLELLCMGVPSILITTADNQRGIARRLSQDGIVTSLGWYGNINRNDVRTAVAELAADVKLRTTFIERGQKLVDGFGAQRVIDKMIEADATR